MPEVVGLDELRCDRHAVERRVGRPVDALVLDAHEAGVLDAAGLRRAPRPQHPLGERGRRRELDLVAALGDAPRQLGGPRGGRPREPLVGERSQDRVELVATEAGVQPGDDERGGLAIDVRPDESGREHRTVIRRPRRVSGLDVRAGIIDAELPGGAQNAGAELHRREMPFTDRPQAQDEPAAPGRQARLVGVHDRGGIEEGGRLDRELVGEPRAHEAASLLRQIGSVGYPVRDLLVVRHQHARQVTVARRVAVTDLFQGRSDLVVGQREDPREHP